MKIARIKISNFRGIKSAELLLPDHVVLVGDNNTGKSSVLEAIDLVIGPERLRRSSPIDEHDFYAGEYIGTDEAPIAITVEVVVIGLSNEQILHFGNHIEWWNTETATLLNEPPPEETDRPQVIHALRLGFEGKYDAEEDDFACETFFMSPEGEDGARDTFRTRDKRLCGFLFLRTLRTGSRALSLERGSLLDIILRLKELRLNMWEDVLGELRGIAVAENEELGVTEILEEVQNSIRKFVPSEWAENPHIRVSELTREHLRKKTNRFYGNRREHVRRNRIRSTVQPPRDGDDKHPCVGVAGDDRRPQEERDICDGGARDCDPAAHPAQDRGQRPRHGCSVHFHISFPLRFG